LCLLPIDVLKPIQTGREYKKALRVAEKYFDSNINTKTGALVSVLIFLIEKYEEQSFPIGNPDPIEAIKFRLDQLQWTQKDFAEFLGSRSRASEILSYKRRLSINNIRRLHSELKIPADVLIGG
jgi:HTH-type transcriptional regulator/antitoxin HigA